MGYTQIFERIFLKFPVHLIFIPEFTELSVERFAFRKFNNFQIFSAGILLRKFPYHDFGNLGPMESAQGQPHEVIQIFGDFLPEIIVLKLNFLLRGILV